MTDFDLTDPWGQKSPWDEAQPNQTPEAPVTNPAVVSANPFEIGMTLKAAGGFEAEWLTPRVAGSSAEDTAQKAHDLLMAMKSKGLIDFFSQAAEYTRSTYKGGGAKPTTSAPVAQPTFNPNSGQVQYNQAPQAPFGGGGESDQGVTSCIHGQRTHRVGATWEAMFCPAREKSEQCLPAWKDKKTGKYAVKG